MKTILTRLKTLINNNNNDGGTLSYVKSVEVVHPELDLTLTPFPALPRVTFVGENTREEWVAQRKELTNTVTAYLMLRYMQRETSILGDSSRAGGQGKGILDFVNDFLTVVRGHRLEQGDDIYLSKPLDIINIEYIRESLDGNAHLLIAAITMECVHLLAYASLPGDI